MIAGAADDRDLLSDTRSRGQAALPMLRRDTRSSSAFKDRMNGDEPALIENADHVG